MKKYFLPAAAAAALVTGLASTAQAQGYDSDSGFYTGGGLAYYDIEPAGAESGVDTSAIFARGGYAFNNTFSVEAELATGIDDGEFDFNVDEDEFNLDDNEDTDLNDVIAASGDIGLNYLVGVYGKANLPLTERVNAFARAGYAYVDLDASITTPGGNSLNVEDSADGPSVGAGLEYDIDGNWYLRGDYAYYNLEDTDTNGAMLSVGYKF